jgi:putative transposase
VIVRKAFQYRLCPTRAQGVEMQTMLDRCRELYNAGLEERREAYRRCDASVSSAAQQAQLPEVKRLRPEYADLDAQMLQDVLQRLDRAFTGFFRRLKAGQKAGYPRFKSRDRYDSCTFKQTGWKLQDGRLSLRGIGALKVRWSRPIEGTIKTVTIRRDADQWYVCFSCVVEIADPLPDSARPAVGIDLGLEHFATLSDGTHIANPRHFRTGEAGLARRQQALSRKKRGSNRRKKARLLVAKAHRKTRNQRRDFQHKTANRLVQTHGLIAVEDLRVGNMVRNHCLAKSISDAGWGQFIAILSSKAEGAGCTVVAVNPAGTSQACSQCGMLCPKALDVRWHQCDHCGCSLQRDHNAARNILALGQSVQARPA